MSRLIRVQRCRSGEPGVRVFRVGLGPRSFLNLGSTRKGRLVWVAGRSWIRAWGIGDDGWLSCRHIGSGPAVNGSGVAGLSGRGRIEANQ